MLNPINITTESGIRLDVSPSATIEVNMGGISLLDLSSRTATYTNSFSLPRTPTNESVFAFASQPTRNNRPSIDVWITKGLFQRKAVLNVIEFVSEYKCSIRYDSDGIIDALSAINVNILPLQNSVLLTYSSNPFDLQYIFETLMNQRDDGLVFFPMTYKHIISNPNNKRKNGALSLLSILSLIESSNSFTFTGDFLTSGDIEKLVVFNKYAYATTVITGATSRQIKQTIEADATNDVYSAKDLIKTVCQLLLLDLTFVGSEIKATKVEDKILSQGISLEGFSNVNKKYSSGYAKKNFINYKLSKLVKAGFGSDYFIAEGQGEKTVIELDSYIPAFYDIPTNEAGYDNLEADSIKQKQIFAYKETVDIQNVILDTNTVDDIITYGGFIQTFEPLSSYPFYSNILNPIFANPVILEANKYLDPLTADNIMTTRVINSVQLGGRYWLDTMAYNLTTGQSKMTLIQLP